MAKNEQIGDVKFTSSLNLDSTWLPCNGIPLDNNEYPELCNMLSLNKNSSLILSDLKPAGSILDIWVDEERAAILSENSTSTGAIVYWRNHGESTWNSHEFTTTTTQVKEAYISYVNGYIVILTSVYSSSSYHYTYIYYAKQSDPFTFTRQAGSYNSDTSTLGYRYRFSRVRYNPIDGIYYFAFNSKNASQINCFYTDDLTYDEWNSYNVAAGYVKDFIYKDGYYYLYRQSGAYVYRHAFTYPFSTPTQTNGCNYGTINIHCGFDLSTSTYFPLTDGDGNLYLYDYNLNKIATLISGSGYPIWIDRKNDIVTILTRSHIVQYNIVTKNISSVPFEQTPRWGFVDFSLPAYLISIDSSLYEAKKSTPIIGSEKARAYIKAEDVEKFNITFNTATYCSITYNDKSTNDNTLKSPFRIPVGDSIDFMATGTMNGYAWIYLNGNLVSQAGSNQLGCTYHFTPTSNINIVCETYKASVGTGRGGVIRITEL